MQPFRSFGHYIVKTTHMKYRTAISIGLLSILLIACKKNESCSGCGIVDEWKLVEELMDPGDGSGTFQSVASTKKITFYSNGTFASNGEMCSMTNQSGSNHDGDYVTSTGTINPDNCASTQPLGITYTLDVDTLILHYPCFEGCAQKYYRN